MERLGNLIGRVRNSIEVYKNGSWLDEQPPSEYLQGLIWSLAKLQKELNNISDPIDESVIRYFTRQFCEESLHEGFFLTNIMMALMRIAEDYIFSQQKKEQEKLLLVRMQAEFNVMNTNNNIEIVSVELD
jgi:hypothetical protein